MKNEQKKNYLKRYKKNQAKIKRLEEKIEYIDSKLTKVSSMPMNGEIRGSNGVSKEDLIIDKIDYEKRVEHLKTIGKQYKYEITSAIDSLDDTRHIDVLESFFIDCLTFDETAIRLGYTLRHTIALYSQAIDRIEIPNT